MTEPQPQRSEPLGITGAQIEWGEAKRREQPTATEHHPNCKSLFNPPLECNCIPQPPATEQEWTPERLIKYLDTKARDGSFKDRMQLIANDINAALKAEREKATEVERQRWQGVHHDLTKAIESREYFCQQLLSAQQKNGITYERTRPNRHDERG